MRVTSSYDNKTKCRLSDLWGQRMFNIEIHEFCSIRVCTVISCNPFMEQQKISRRFVTNTSINPGDYWGSNPHAGASPMTTLVLQHCIQYSEAPDVVTYDTGIPIIRDAPCYKYRQVSSTLRFNYSMRYRRCDMITEGGDRTTVRRAEDTECRTATNHR